MSTTAEKQFAVVTGGSSGIGLELAKQFAQNGFDVLIAAEPDGLSEAAQEIATLGADVDTLAVDLATPDGVHALIERIEASGRPLDAIAINAGVGVGGPFAETDYNEELNLISLNVVSTVSPRQARRQGHGGAQQRASILFTASVASVMPAPFEAVYGASKAFILSLSEALLQRAEGHRCNRDRTDAGAERDQFLPPRRHGRHPRRPEQEGRPRRGRSSRALRP